VPQTAYAPEQLRAIASQLGQTYADGEARILRILAQGNITEWKRAFLREQLRQIRAILGQLSTETGAWAQMHLPGLYAAGMRFVEQALPGTIDPALASLHTQAIQLIGENLATELGDALTRVGRTTDDVFRRVGMEQIQQGLVGGEARPQVSQRIVADLRRRGLTSFTDKAGREWSLSQYAAMVARTTTREAVAAGGRNRQLEAGYDLAVISSHPGSCELCAPWEGEIVSLTGATDGYPTLNDAIDEGYNHPNCGHSEMPYVPELSEVGD